MVAPDDSQVTFPLGVSEAPLDTVAEANLTYIVVAPTVPPLSDNTTLDANPLPKPKTYEEIQKEKAELLRLLERMQNRGEQLDKQYTMNSDMSDMQAEYDRIKRKRLHIMEI